MTIRALPLLLIACGSGRSPTPANHARPTVTRTLPAHYAALFREDGRWTYDVFVQFPSEHGPIKKTYSVACRVVKLDAATDRVASTIKCDAPAVTVPTNSSIGQPSLDGTWVAKTEGLFDERDQLVIAAAPQTGIDGRVITREGTSWCVAEAPDAAPGPAGSDVICFASSGVVSQRRTFDPGNVDDHEEYVMTLAKQ
jgi:hypothetical protein